MRLTLRAQIALTTGAIALLVVAIAGVVIALRIDHRDRALVDEQLQARAERVIADVDKLLTDGTTNQPGDDGYGDLLDGSESLVRLIEGNAVVAQRGAIPDQTPPIPGNDGFSRVDVDGVAWRSYVVSANDDIRLQVLQSLQPVDERRAANTRLLSLVTALAAIGSGAAGWFAGSRLLRPLGRLSTGAVTIAEDPDPDHRLPDVAGPPEIAALSNTLNGMLDRLSAAGETTRRFAADIGHELRGPLTASSAYLETLLARGDLSSEAREQVEAANTQQKRMVTTLAALQVLARVDAGAVPKPEEVEPGLLVDELVRLARLRHPDVNFTVTDTSDGAGVDGWREGLRIAVDNLIDNAAVHGRRHGNVAISVTAAGRCVSITVSDDGPGISEDQREVPAPGSHGARTRLRAVADSGSRSWISRRPCTVEPFDSTPHPRADSR